MPRFLIHICPGLMDWLIFLTTFAVLYRAGEMHLTLMQCACLAGILSLTYMIFSLVSGKLLSRRNARLMLVFSIVFSLLSVIICLYAVQFKVMLLGMALAGIFMAVFFNSFQAFIRGESAPGSLMKTVGFYTLSWSAGMSFGFISSGYFYRFGTHTLAFLSLVLSFVMLAIILMHKRRPFTDISSEEHSEEGPANARQVDARYVRIGWMMIFTAMFVQKPIVSFFPVISANEGLTPFLASLPLFLNHGVQALFGLSMIKFRRLLYRRTPLMIAQLAAAVLFLIIWLHPTLTVCFLVLGILGLYLGFVYFSSVYYCCNSGNRALNVGINEFLVGLSTLAGIFICEWWMKYTANTTNMYAVCGAVVLASAFIQLLVAKNRRR
jgi:MFS family permease